MVKCFPPVTNLVPLAWPMDGGEVDRHKIVISRMMHLRRASAASCGIVLWVEKNLEKELF